MAIAQLAAYQATVKTAKTILSNKGVDTMQPKVKLAYDVPPETKQMLIDDANKEGITATQLLIRLIEQNHAKEGSVND